MNAFQPWEPPFQYNENNASIEDKRGERILDVRGWGRLTGKGMGALGMSERRAIEIQNGIGRRIVELMNQDKS